MDLKQQVVNFEPQLVEVEVDGVRLTVQARSENGKLQMVWPKGITDGMSPQAAQGFALAIANQVAEALISRGVIKGRGLKKTVN
jgi:hypothetical protein